MMKEWATVMSWQAGIATLSTHAKTTCSRCSARQGCGSQLLNKLVQKNADLLTIESNEPLLPGQKIELGIPESSLLGSALLVYMTPLMLLFIFAGLAQHWLQNDFAAAGGALLGGVLGFFLAKQLARHLAKRPAMQPIILKVTLPIAKITTENQ